METWKEKAQHRVHLKLRTVYFWWQRRTRGWDDSELWNLDNTVANFVYPRLKRLYEIGHGHPSSLTPEKWVKVMDDMLFAFDKCREVEFYKPEEEKRIRRGLNYFAKYYRSLWD